METICLDVANGYSEAFVEAVRQVRAKFPSKTIVAGNVVTGEMVEELILSGADIVKVGIGPGSVCTTRKQTGVGYPQLRCVRRMCGVVVVWCGCGVVVVWCGMVWCGVVWLWCGCGVVWCGMVW